MSKTFQSPLFKEPELVQLGSVWRHWGLQVTRPPQSHQDRPSLSLKLSLLVSGKEGAEVLVRERVQLIWRSYQGKRYFPGQYNHSGPLDKRDIHIPWHLK